VSRRDRSDLSPTPTRSRSKPAKPIDTYTGPL
jgi:hypothetical protein